MLLEEEQNILKRDFTAPPLEDNFNKSVLTTPKTVRPKSPVDYGPAVQQAKQNKALGKQSSVCLTYY